VKRYPFDSLLGVLDRRDKDAITLLFVAVPKKTSVNVDRVNEIALGDCNA
jgi:hypothetical protein